MRRGEELLAKRFSSLHFTALEAFPFSFAALEVSPGARSLFLILYQLSGTAWPSRARRIYLLVRATAGRSAFLAEAGVSAVELEP